MIDGFAESPAAPETGESPAAQPGAAEEARRKQAIAEELARHPFEEAWWLRGAHAQTVWSPFFRRLPAVTPRRERWMTPDDDFLNVHVIESRKGGPRALVLHGLEGSARSNYVVGLMDKLGALGWGVWAMEHRSCGGEMNRARRLYHSGETTDLAFAVGRLIELDPDAPIYLVGVSLGGNVTARWLGHLGAAVPTQVRAAAVLCPPFDLVTAGPALDRAAGGLYTRKFLRTLIPKAIAKERQYPGCVDIERVKRSRTFEEFDTHATAALHGFRDCWDYWGQVGCGQVLGQIRRPTLLIASADDPFNPASTLPRKTAARSPWLVPLFTERGGHVGFVSGPSPRRSRHWAEEQIVRFFRKIEEGA